MFYVEKICCGIIHGCSLAYILFFLSREAAEVSKEITPEKNQQKVVVVDPGHGGDDPGMIGVGGLKEKGINLAVSMELKAALEQQGFVVVMTREEDKGLYDNVSHNKKAQDMQRRISLINEANPVLTVSIHQNSYPDASVRGPQVFIIRIPRRGTACEGTAGKPEYRTWNRTPEGGERKYDLLSSEAQLGGTGDRGMWIFDESG